ncbi:MAG: deoxycytidine deaminase [Bdellovibrionales bacterium]
MILTASEISACQARGEINITPYDAKRLNPCSYTYRLGPDLGVPVIHPDNSVTFETITIPPEGYVLQPGRMYLGHTLETLGSTHYAMSLVGRSSLGRLGLFLQVTANLINVGSQHQITLELVAALPLRVYAGMDIGEMSFWQTYGDVKRYQGGYSAYNAPTASQHRERQ